VLTADLVSARRRGDELQVPVLDPPARARVEDLAGVYLDIARAHVGRSRDELEATWRAVQVAPRDRRLGDGVLKLVSDRCIFETSAEVDPAELRAQVFLSASAARRAPAPAPTPDSDGKLPSRGEGIIDRAAIIAAVARERGVSAVEIDRWLYADLHGAERLCQVTPIRPAQLAAGFDQSQAQAVLLRATRVVAEVSAPDPAAYRQLFRKLKFLRLLHAIRAIPGGYRVEIDGPFSLFQAVTKYGLQLALALPAIAACGRWRLEADVLWGKERRPVIFRTAGDAGACGDPAASRSDPSLSDDVAALLERVAARDSGWIASPATAILDLPGAGVCVPDLVFRRKPPVAPARGSKAAAGSASGPGGPEVYLEVMGFWSRDAVWRRVELIERGLPHRILFAVSKHLRVSEAALGDDLPGSLYVYARTLDARAVLDHVERLAARPLS
jgi:predicted nuclease of restriction endonuclease-like RecB superfamily